MGKVLEFCYPRNRKAPRSIEEIDIHIVGEDMEVFRSVSNNIAARVIRFLLEEEQRIQIESHKNNLDKKEEKEKQK